MENSEKVAQKNNSLSQAMKLLIALVVSFLLGLGLMFWGYPHIVSTRYLVNNQSEWLQRIWKEVAEDPSLMRKGGIDTVGVDVRVTESDSTVIRKRAVEILAQEAQGAIIIGGDVPSMAKPIIEEKREEVKSPKQTIASKIRNVFRKEEKKDPPKQEVVIQIPKPQYQIGIGSASDIPYKSVYISRTSRGDTIVTTFSHPSKAWNQEFRPAPDSIVIKKIQERINIVTEKQPSTLLVDKKDSTKKEGRTFWDDVTSHSAAIGLGFLFGTILK